MFPTRQSCLSLSVSSKRPSRYGPGFAIAFRIHKITFGLFSEVEKLFDMLQHMHAFFQSLQFLRFGSAILMNFDIIPLGSAAYLSSTTLMAGSSFFTSAANSFVSADIA